MAEPRQGARGSVRPTVAGILLACTGVASAQPQAATQRSDAAARVVHHAIESPLQSGPTWIRVLAPDVVTPGKAYRVLYVLPVTANDDDHYGDGLLECQKLGVANRHDVFCVAPSFSDLPWYADHPTAPGIRQESYFLSVVVPFVEAHYPVEATKRGRLLLGFSKSGWGAFSLILRNPDKFAKAVAWDAPLMAENTDRWGMSRVFGTPDNFEAYRVSRLLTEQAEHFRDANRLIHLGYGSFREHHKAAEALLTSLGIRHRYKDGPERTHAWDGGWMPDAVASLFDESSGE